jgi:23S rRNA pseudouridine2605 synthase
MSKAAFGKFINPKPSGAKKKEQHRQEKRAIKKERAAYFDNVKAEKRKAYQEAKQQKDFFEQTKRGIKPNFSTTRTATNTPANNTDNKTTFIKKEFAPKKIAPQERTVFDKEGKPMRKRIYSETEKYNPAAGKKSFYKSKETIATEKQASFDSNVQRPIKQKAKTETEIIEEIEQARSIKPYTTKANTAPVGRVQQSIIPNNRSNASKKERIEPTSTRKAKPNNIPKEFIQPLNKPVTIIKKKADEAMPLNKFVAHCGVCSRREAADIVKLGKIQVNNKVVTEPGYKVLETDIVKFDGKIIKSQNNLVYILLNKPKDFLTTADDPQGRKTVMDLVGNATPERIYPVGRLDRNTTGVLLFTNDGDLAQKLTHPKFAVKKIYEVKLDKALTKADAEKILGGITLEDGLVTPDALAFVDGTDKSIIGIEIHTGKNRIVRRIFEHLGYDVKNLDRVMFANLTKKNVERGRYRFLNEKEIRLLKILNSSKSK